VEPRDTLDLIDVVLATAGEGLAEVGVGHRHVPANELLASAEGTDGLGAGVSLELGVRERRSVQRTLPL
jgi:hypothetical protein